MVEIYDEGHNYSTPWYIRDMMDKDTVHLFVSDLSYEDEDYLEEEVSKVSTDFVLFLLTPSYLKEIGVDPSLWIDLKDFKERSVQLIKKISPPEIINSTGEFRKRIQVFLNRVLSDLYNAEWEDARILVREIITFLGYDFPLENIDQNDLAAYHSSYTSISKVLSSLAGLSICGFNPEEFRNGNYYLKKVHPAPWDYVEFVKVVSRYVILLFLESYCDSSPSWEDKFQESERWFGILERVIFSNKIVYVRNKKNEIWSCNLEILAKKVIQEAVYAASSSLPDGSREDFIEFLPHDVEKIAIKKVVYRPWLKIK
jgi:hypothetical protein